MRKRILSFLVALVMLLASLPLSSIDVSAATNQTGKYGGVNWSLDENTGTLTFSKGTASSLYAAGEMYDDWQPSSYRFGSFDCTTVKKIIIEEGVTSIGCYSFYNMTNLEEIEISEGLEEIHAYAFQGCTSLTEISLPSSLKTIYNYAFQGCTNLESVTLQNGLETIATEAFCNCTKLTDIAYPASVKNVGDDTLKNTAFLKNNVSSSYYVDDIDYVVCGNTLVYFKTNSSQSDYTIPDGIYCIAGDALDNAYIGTLYTNEVKYISDGVGCNNKNFRNIYFENVEEIGSAFAQCSLRNIYFYDGLKAITGASAFGTEGCAHDIYYYNGEGVFPPTLEYVYAYALSSRTDSTIGYLKSQADEEGIPLYIDHVLMGVFSNNYNYEDTFVIKEGTKVIAEKAFSHSTGSSSNGSYENVTTMEIPSSIVTMDNVKVFPNLTDIYYAGSRNDWKAINHLGTYDGITIHYGSECAEHHYEAEVTKPTCTTDGYTTYTCTECGDTYTGDSVKASHSYGAYKTTKKATTSSNGTQTATCTECGDEITKTIKKISDISLSATSYTYNGKVKTPSVTVKDSKGNKLTKGTDYTVAYASGRKNVGKYAVKITFKGNYSGSKTLYFKINPKATTISSLTKGSKQFTVKWKKQSTQVTGYQIRYSTSSSMSSAKTVTVSSYKTTQKTIKSLKAKKKYYVQIRTYKTVNGTKYYSSWSAKKNVTTK